MERDQAEAVADGVHSAVLTIMDGVGSYPMTRQDILDAIRLGVKDAFIEVFGS